MNSRSSHRSCSVKESIVNNFAKFTSKHLCQSLFYNEVTSLRPATFLNKKLWYRCFPLNFARFLRTSIFFYEHLLQKRLRSTVSGTISFESKQKTFSGWFQRQLYVGFLWKMCSEQFCGICWKMTLLESFINKIAGYRPLTLF